MRIVISMENALILVNSLECVQLYVDVNGALKGYRTVYNVSGQH